MLNFSKCFIYFLFFATASAYAAEKQGSNAPTYLVSGDAQLLTHFIDRGLSITDQNPALNASFLFNLGQQFRFGFWGSNISNITSADDNLWLKIVADIRVELSGTSKLMFYMNDDHFYKSNIRNGQEVGINVDYNNAYFYQLEFMNNYQGSKTNAEYIKGGKKFAVASSTIISASLGYTLQKAEGYSNYFDGKILAEYQLSQYLNLDAGFTSTLSANGYNGRGNPYIYFGIKLAY